MAIAVALENSTPCGSAINATFTSGSFTPDDNSRVLVFVCCERNSHTTAFSWSITDSVDGASGWTVDTTTSAYNFAGAANFATAGALFYKDFGVGAASRTVTVDAFATTDTGYYSLVVISVTGHNVGSPFAQARVASGEDEGTTGDAHSGTLTLGSNPTSGNAVIAFFGAGGDATGQATTPSGYTNLASQSDQYTHINASYHLATTDPAATSSDLGQSVGNWCGVIMEIAAAGGGGGQPVVQESEWLTLEPQTNPSAISVW